MENINIPAEKGKYFIPAVVCDAEAGLCEISGESYLEDAFSFYQPIIDWVETFCKNNESVLNVNLRFSYFNTSSSKAILSLLKKLKTLQDDGFGVVVNWYYEESDTDMLEEAEDFISDTDLNMYLLPY